MADVNGGAEKIAAQILNSSVESENYLFFVKQKKIVVIVGDKRSEFGLFRGLLKISCANFNSVISHFYYTHIILCFMSLFMFYRCNKIFLVHSGYYPDTFSKFDQTIIRVLRYVFGRWKSADLVYTSEFSQACHLKIGWPMGRVVRNVSVPPKKIILDLQNINRTDSEKVSIGFVGRDHPDKGIDLLLNIIKAHEQCENVNFSLIISEPKTDYSKLNLANTIFEDETDDIFKYLFNIDILLVPSRNESYPMIILEALNVGCTVVAAGVGGIPEIMSSRLHLIEGRQLSSWVKKISELHADKLPNKRDVAREMVDDNLIDKYLMNLEHKNG